jgi:hypothetical protein
MEPVDGRGCEGRQLTTRNTLLDVVNMPRRRHPKPAVEGALVEAERAGWEIEPTRSGHRWGVMRCQERSREGCQASIWSTPRSADDHARQLQRAIGRCPHGEEERG